MTGLDDLPINQRVISLLKSQGLSELFPPQEAAFKAGVLEGKNLVLAVPTSSGKTLVAEICMLKSILEGKGKALYLVPLRALAHEKYAEFKKYESLGINTAISVGDFDSSGTRLKDADIAVLTNERADSLIRHKTEWLNEVGIIVVDEVHLVNDMSRGPTVEMVLAKVRQMLPHVQLVALSATISNAEMIAEWLDAKLVRSDWRPVPLTEGIYLDSEIRFGDGRKRHVRRARREELADFVCDIIEEGGQVIVFVSSRRFAVSVAKRLASFIRPYLSKESSNHLARIADRIGGGASIPEATKTLAKMMRNGSAFHHAGLANRERALIEDAFRNDHLKVVVATPTLAAGVNLPARRVIIRDYRRFTQGRGNYPIPILEYKQMAGRAGRPKYDKYGEAVLIAKTEEEYNFLTDHYIMSEPEEITSKLASPSAVRTHILAAIAGEMVSDREELDELINGTFFSFQFESWEIEDHIETALTFLDDGKLIVCHPEGQLEATTLGQRASRLYIDPATAILFRDTFADAECITELGVLHLICHSDDQPVSYVTQASAEEYEMFLMDNQDDLLVQPPDMWEDLDDYANYLAEIKTALMLDDWISELTEKDITDKHNVGMGDVHRYVQTAEWLLYAASEIARITGSSRHISTLNNLRSRMRHGVRPELLELVSLRGVGRVRGRMLFNHDLKNLKALYDVPIVELARVPTIGTSVATSIKRQIGIDIEAPATTAIEAEMDDPLSTDPIQTLLEDFDIGND